MKQGAVQNQGSSNSNQKGKKKVQRNNSERNVNKNVNTLKQESENQMRNSTMKIEMQKKPIYLGDTLKERYQDNNEADQQQKNEYNKIKKPSITINNSIENVVQQDSSKSSFSDLSAADEQENKDIIIENSQQMKKNSKSNESKGSNSKDQNIQQNEQDIQNIQIEKKNYKRHGKIPNSAESSPHITTTTHFPTKSHKEDETMKSTSIQQIQGQESLKPDQIQNQAASNKSNQVEEEGSFAVFKCPIVLEKYNIKLWIVYLDNFIEVMFRLPVQLIGLVIAYLVWGRKIEKKERHIFIHFLIIAIPFLLFAGNRNFFQISEYIEVSYLYHAFRGQSTLKLYGVLMTAEIIDKMLCQVGEYFILDVLWQKISKASLLELIQFLIPTIIYVFIHSLVLFLQLVGYNVILNSDISFLFVLIFVHNSMKLKSSIFKKFSKDGYVQSTHVDLRTRFSKCFYVFLIWASMSGFSTDIVRKLLYFLGTEVIVEWIKHIFLMLLNNLKLSIVESMNRATKLFVARVRIFPAFQTQEIVIHKAEQTFQEREKYLSSTPDISPSLIVGFRINFIVFHHAVLLFKIMFPLVVANFSIRNTGIAILTLRALEIIVDLLTLSFSFNSNDIIKQYTLKQASFFKTLFSLRDLIIFPLGIMIMFSEELLQMYSQLQMNLTSYI